MDIKLTPIQAIEALIEEKMKYYRKHTTDDMVLMFDGDLKGLRRFFINEYLEYPSMLGLAEEYHVKFHFNDEETVVCIIDYFDPDVTLAKFPIKPEGKQVKITKRKLKAVPKNTPKFKVIQGGKSKRKLRNN